MPNQIMCVERLASIQFERNDSRFKLKHGRLIFSQTQDTVDQHFLVCERELIKNTREATPGWKPCGGVPRTYIEEKSKRQNHSNLFGKSIRQFKKLVYPQI